MYFRTDDALADFDRWEAEQAKHTNELPVCADCGEPVQEDHYYWINDEVICPECLEAGYRMSTDDYIE